MATTAATLDILVNARTASATSSLRRMDSSAKQSASHLQNLDRTSGRLTSTLSRVGKAAVGAAAGYVGLSAAKTAISTTADLAKTTISLQKNMGFTAKTASELGANLKIRGADAKQASMAFATFAGVLHQAGQGSASATDRLAELGISGKILKRDLKDPQKALFDVSEGLKNLGSGVARTDDARKLFGRGWQSLAPILRGGADELKKNLDMADEMGASFSNLGIKNMQDFIDAQHQAQLGMIGLQIGFTQTLGPALIGAMNQFSTLAKNIREKGFVPAISDAISKAAERAGEMAPKVLAAFAKGFADTSLQGKLALSAILIGKLGGSKAWLFLGKKFGLAIIEGLAGTKIGAALLAQFPSVARMNEEGRVRGGAMGSGMVAGLVLGTVGLAAVLGNKIASIVPNISVFSKGYIQKQFGYAFQAIQQAIPTMSNLGGKVAAAFRNPLSGGLFKGLAGDLRTKLFGPFQQAAGWITGAFQKVIGFFNGLPSQIKSAFAGVGRFIISPFSNAVSAIRGFIQDIIGIINTVLGPVGVHIGGGGGGGGGGQGAGNANSATHSKPRNQRQKGGGIFVGGSGSGDKVPAMLEPGEFVLNRNAVSAIGLGNVSKLNKDIPRFARGGLSSTNPRGRGATGHPTTATSAAGGFGLPGLGGIPGWLQPAGGFVLDKVGGFIKKKLSSLIPNVGGDLLLQTNTPAQVAKVLNTGVGFGKSHAGGPYTWGGGHSSFSGPYDCSGYVSAILHSMGMLSSPQTTDGLKNWGQAGPGRFLTVGVRGTTGRNAHTMMRIGNLFFESGGGHGAAVEGGWDGSFPIKRHWPGLAEGGTVMDVLKRHKIKLGPKSFDPHSPDFVGWGLQSGGHISVGPNDRRTAKQRRKWLRHNYKNFASVLRANHISNYLGGGEWLSVLAGYATAYGDSPEKYQRLHGGLSDPDNWHGKWSANDLKQRGGLIQRLQGGGTVSDRYTNFWPFDLWAMENFKHSTRFPSHPDHPTWLSMLGQYAKHEKLNPRKLIGLHGSSKKDAAKWYGQWVHGGSSVFLQRGGKVSAHSPSRPAIGNQWLNANTSPGGRVGPNEIFTMVRQLGGSKGDAAFLSSVAFGESGYRNIAQRGGLGRGVVQVDIGQNPQYAHWNLLNPWEDLVAGIALHHSGAPWYGNRGPAGHLLVDAIRGSRGGGKTKTPKTKGPTGGASGGGDDPNAAVLQGLLDAGDTRRTSRIDLINEANLEALQRYQAGASQNPLLGIGSPGFPTPTSTNLPSPMDQMLLDLGIDPAGKPYPGARSKHPKDTPGMFAQHAKEHHHHHHTVHVHIDGKELKKGVKKETRTESRRGHRPLPSSRRS